MPRHKLNKQTLGRKQMEEQREFWLTATNMGIETCPHCGHSADRHLAPGQPREEHQVSGHCFVCDLDCPLTYPDSAHGLVLQNQPTEGVELGRLIVIVYKAQPSFDGHQIPSLEIRATESIPEMNAPDWQRQSADLHDYQAEAIVNALFETLPGGTTDRILSKMLERKASLLNVRSKGHDS
jgi:hypothetical protein